MACLWLLKGSQVKVLHAGGFMLPSAAAVCPSFCGFCCCGVVRLLLDWLAVMVKVALD